MGFNVRPEYDYVFLESNFMLHRHLQRYGLAKHHFPEYEMLIKKTNPCKEFHIVLDGVPPSFRINHMRRSRIKYAPGVKHKLQITCGTKFINQYEESLLKWSKKFDNVHISTTQMIGEGETKIFKMIHERKLDNCLVISPDNDVIPMAMSTGRHVDLCLFKRSGTDGSSYDLIQMSKVYGKLESIAKEFDTFQLKRDVMLLALFLGNDYLPRINSQFDFSQATNAYFEIYTQIKDTYLIKQTPSGEWDINFDILKQIVKHSIRELDRLKNTVTKHDIYEYCRVLLWNFELYYNAKCVDQHLVVDLPKAPPVECIYDLYMMDKHDFIQNIQPKVCARSPIQHETVAIAVMPQHGHEFVDEKFRHLCLSGYEVTPNALFDLDNRVLELKK